MADVREGPRLKGGQWGSGRAAPVSPGAWLLRGLHAFYAMAGRLLTAGLVMALLAMWALFGLAAGVMAGRTARFDEGVLLWMNRRATPTLDVAALQVTALGNGLVVATICVVAATFLWLAGHRAYAALVTAGVGGASVIYPLLKLAFDRPRPRLFEWRADYAHSSSFPSGHATLSMALLALLAYAVHRLANRRAVSVAALLVAGTAVLLIGLSRLYLGVHYPSDVIAGYMVGFCWAVVCALAMEALRAASRGPARAEPPGRTPTRAERGNG
jgi:undecaprenyl-diphosphatase